MTRPLPLFVVLLFVLGACPPVPLGGEGTIAPATAIDAGAPDLPGQGASASGIQDSGSGSGDTRGTGGSADGTPDTIIGADGAPDTIIGADGAPDVGMGDDAMADTGGGPDHVGIAPSLDQAPTTKKGLTWGKLNHYDEFGLDYLGCGGAPLINGTECNPKEGDTLCSEARPILCLNNQDLPRPAYPLRGKAFSMPQEYYNGWSGGTFALTAAIVGTRLTSKDVASGICASTFGPGWRMADHAAGWWVLGMDESHFFGDTWTSAPKEVSGWNLYGYGTVASGIRYWVAIDDQLANCWN